MRARNKLSVSEKHDIVKAYKDGEKFNFITARWDIHCSTLMRLLRKAGVTMRGRGRPRRREV